MNRYCRNVTFSEIGPDGQRKLQESHAVVIGTGALGGTIALHLVRAGIGTVTLCENDTIDMHNIQRQLLYTEKDIGKSKLQISLEKLRAMNSEVAIKGFEEFLSEDNAKKIIENADIVLDGTDSMVPRYIMNKYCINNNIPYIYGGVLGSYGMTLNIIPQKSPCLACVFPPSKAMEHLPTCAEVGIVNTVPAIIGSIQATECMKILTGAKYSKDLIIYDVWYQSFDKVPIKKRKNCPVCG